MTPTEAFTRVAGTNPVVQAFVGGLVIAGFNTAGALLVLLWRNPSHRALDAALGFAAGVMLSASFTSLILPGIEFANAPGYDAVSIGSFSLVGVGPVVLGFLAGVAILDRADAWVPRMHTVVTGRAGRAALEDEDHPVDPTRLAGLLLFVVAITLHNIPEGLAVGVAFGSGDLGNALALMLAIGIQNVPEGLAVSVAAINAGLGRLFYAAVAGVRAGAVEVPIAVLGALAVAVAAPLLPYAMGFAAGGMLFVISDEIVPETHAGGHERIATLGTMAGVLLMLYLDVTLG